MGERLEPAVGVPGLEPLRSRDYRWCAVLMGLLGVVVLLVLFPNFRKCRNYGQLTAFKSNCENIATALETHASYFGGRYPRRFEQLTVGNHLKLIPTCPAVGRMTYTNYHVSQKPDSYRFACVRDNHARSYADYGKPSNNSPRYNSESGLVDHP